MLTTRHGEQKELEQFLETEQAQARVQNQIHTLTSLCWDKCVFPPLLLAPSGSQSFPRFPLSRCVGSISSSFSSKEQTCLENCVGRFFDASDYLIRRVEQQRAEAGMLTQ